MKSRSFRNTSIASIALVTLALSACGTSTTEDDAADAPADNNGEPVEITYMHRLPDGEGMTPVAEIVDKWNAENPDIQVKGTKFDGAAPEMTLKLETDINAGAGVCLAQLSYSEIPEMFVKGLVQDVSAQAETYSDDFSAGALAMMTVGDAVVGLPQDTGPLVYFYNEEAFNDLGIEVPTTVDEFTESAKVAAAEGKYIGAFTPDEAHNWLMAQSTAAGDVWYSSSDGKWDVNTNDSGSMAVADMWQDGIDNETVLIDQRWGDGFTEALTDGSLIGHVGAAWEAGFLLDPLDGTPDEGKWRVAPIVDYGAGEMNGPDGGSGVAVMEGCEYPNEAMEFNAWLNTQVEDLASQGLVPAASQPATTPEKLTRQFGGQDVMAELSAATENLNPDFAYSPGFSSLATMNEEAARAATGDATVADVFDVAQQTSIDTLNNLGLPVNN